MSVFARPSPGDVYPARLEAGDVVDVPGRGHLTLAGQGYVASSAKPTWFRFKVVGGKPFDVDTKETVRLVAVGAPVEAKKRAAAVKGPTARATRKPAAEKREIPLTEVTWGMYGEVKGLGPDGSRCTQTGYVNLLPRVCTRGLGMGDKKKYEGEPLLYFHMFEPSGVESGGFGIGMSAVPGTMFSVLDAPQDRPLPMKPTDSRRMIVRDTRADDIVGVTFPEEGYHFGRPGPRLHLTEDPKPGGGGHYELTGLVNGVTETHQMHGEAWVSVDGPAVRHLIKQDPDGEADVPAAEPVEETPATPPDAAPADGVPVPAGAFIYCPAQGCGRKARVRKDRRIGAHSWGGQKCERSGKLLAPGVKIQTPPPAADTLFDLEGMAALFSAIGVELANIAPQAPEPERPAQELSAEGRLLAKVAKKVPADAVQRAEDGSYRVLARWVALGVYVTATGVDQEWKPITASGYVVEARPLRGGFGGRHPDATVVVRLADSVTADREDRGVRMVQVELDGRLVVHGAPADKHPGVGFPYLRLPEELQILEARTRLGLDVEVDDGPHNELWRVEGCKEIISTEVAWWLFGGRYESWEGAAEPRFAARHIAAAIQAGRYRAPESSVLGVSPLVQEHAVPGGMRQQEGRAEYERMLRDGLLIDGAGEPLRVVKCGICEIRKPHDMTSGVTCPYAIVCPTCEAMVNKPCKRPSEHTVWGGLHDAREKLAGDVDDARALAGDLRVPAPYPNTSTALLLAEAVKAAAKKAADPGGPVNGAARTADQHIHGTLSLPYDTQGGGKAGDVVAAYVCCVCGGVEMTEFALGNNHGCCGSGRPMCELIPSSKPLNRHWTPPANGVANDGPVLNDLLAKAVNLEYGQVGRDAARAHAERYAAGLPLVRHKRELDVAWTWVCPVPSCLALVDGHDTIREARAVWFAHAEKHDGFTPAWPDDVVPEEIEDDYQQTKRLAKAKSKKVGPPPARLEVVEPVGNDWWDDSAAAWEQCGLLHRAVVDTRTGRQTVAVMTFPQGCAKAVEFESLLASVGGIDPDAMIVHTMTDKAEQLAEEKRRQEADVRWLGRRLRQIRTLDEIPARPYGQVPTVVEVFDPPTGDPWWDERLAAWDVAGLVNPWSYPPSEGWPNGVQTVKLSTPWDEEQAGRWATELAPLAGLMHDRLRVYRVAAAPEPNVPYQHDEKKSLWSRLHREADQIVTDFGPGTDPAQVVWAMGMTYVGHASVVKRYLDAGREASAFFKGFFGVGNVGKPGRGHCADNVKVEVYQDTYMTGPTADREVLAVVTWPQIADLVETALGADWQLTDRLVAAEGARLAAETSGDRAAERAASDIGAHLVAQLWESVRPAERKPERAPMPEVLALFDMEAISAAVNAALATV